jgi:hypothetical protein
VVSGPIDGIIGAIKSWIGTQDAKAQAAQAGGLALQHGVGPGGAAAQAFAASLLGQYGWGQDQMPPLISLWNQESGWNSNAVNPSSGAYGIPQSLGHGHPYNLGDYKAQVIWGLNYIKSTYGSPSAAWAHERAFNWYDRGGAWPSGTLGFNGSGLTEGVLTGAGVQRLGGMSVVNALNSGQSIGGNSQPMVANIQIPVYYDGQLIENRVYQVILEADAHTARLTNAGSGMAG